MEIAVIDTIDRAMVKPMMTLQNLGKKIIEMTPGPNGIGRMVDQIGRIVEKPGSLTVLRIYAHGNSGMMNVAGGEFDETDSLSTLTLDTLPKVKHQLKQLTPYFAPGARVELLGCAVAKDAEGEKLLVELARIWNVRVQGTPKEEPIAAVQFTGAVYQAAPDGGLVCVPRTEITKG